MATLKELQTDYSLEDACMLYEILSRRNYHAWLATKVNNNGI